MRADRLVAVLLILQARGKVTASKVAAELEISERTARRDLDALGVAGLPVYSRQGRNGGWELLGGGKTDLTGLTADEIRALFLVAGSASTTPALRQAVRKLVRALPEPMRESAERAGEAVVIDPVGWWGIGTVPHRPPHLDDVERAILDGEQIELGYADRSGHTSTRLVHPLGLASKGSNWYLVSTTDAGMRTFRVNRITSVERTGAPVERPPGFDLADAWGEMTAGLLDRMAPIWAVAEATEATLPLLRQLLGDRLRVGARSTTTGRVYVEVAGPTAQAIAGQLAGLGSALVFIGPPGVLEHLAALGDQLQGLYGPEAPAPPSGPGPGSIAF